MAKYNFHDNLVIKLRTIKFDNKNILCINQALGFTLNQLSDKHKLLTQTQLSDIIEHSIGKNKFWDFAVPKSKAEFLVFGAAYSMKPVSTLSVSVSVNNKSKVIMAFGNRNWSEFAPSIPEQFQIIPISYNFAYGGTNYLDNPIGIGYEQNKLPNLEAPDNLITTRNSIVKPTGYEPIPHSWPQRNKLLGGLPPLDCNSLHLELMDNVPLQYFNTAPEDQQLDNFFSGNEAIEIINMHPLYSRIESKIPNIRLRVFIIKKTSEQETIHEMQIKNDTLVLLPNIECGICVYRTTIEITDEEASDIKMIYSFLEDGQSKPQDQSYYFNEILNAYKTQILGIKIDDSPQINNTVTSPYNYTDTIAAKEQINKKNIPQLSDIISNIASKINVPKEQLEKQIQERMASGNTSIPNKEDLINSLKKVERYNESIANKIDKLYEQIELFISTNADHTTKNKS